MVAGFYHWPPMITSIMLMNKLSLKEVICSRSHNEVPHLEFELHMTPQSHINTRL